MALLLDHNKFISSDPLLRSLKPDQRCDRVEIQRGRGERVEWGWRTDMFPWIKQNRKDFLFSARKTKQRGTTNNGVNKGFPRVPLMLCYPTYSRHPYDDAGCIQHLDLIVYAPEFVRFCLSIEQHPFSQFIHATPFPLLVCFVLLLFPPSSSSVPLSVRPMWKLPITRNMRHGNGWTWTWNMQNTQALNKDHAEMWLTASAGRKRPPQDQCNYESFTWRTFRTGQWLVTEGGGGGSWQHYFLPTEPSFNPTSGVQARSSSCLPSAAIIERRAEGKEVCNTCSRVPANIPWSSGPSVMHSINPRD